jgi:hypothetical protein
LQPGRAEFLYGVETLVLKSRYVTFGKAQLEDGYFAIKSLNYSEMCPTQASKLMFVIQNNEMRGKVLSGWCGTNVHWMAALKIRYSSLKIAYVSESISDERIS